jgi:hypothetical protein
MTEERKTPDPGVPDDSRVTDIYRDVARERTPAHLDQAVLKEAARAARPRYWRLRLWTRPAAWAAIVLLSATLLLQVSQVQPPQDGALPEILELEDRAAKRELAEPETGAERQQNDAGSAARATGTNVPRQEAPASPAAASAIAPQADEARPLASRASAESAAPSCDEAARAAPEAWLQCISDLEDAGFTAAAEQERRLLAETFPDFETP